MQRRFRLQRRSDFRRIRAVGTRFQDDVLMVSVAPNEQPQSRFGFIIGKRVGKAIVRNKIRRRLREAVGSMSASLKNGYDVVIVARPASARITYWELRDHVSLLLHRSGLIRKRDQ